MDIKTILDNKEFIPKPLKDQFFLVDESVTDKLVEYADLNKSDVVLEIGAGFGNITREIAKKVKKVVAFEIDTRFNLYLKDLPQNVDLRFEDAWKYVQLNGKFKKKKEYNKVVSNLPYSFCEKLIHNLTFLEYDSVVLLVPLKLVNTIAENGIFSSFFKCDLKEKISKKSFYPVPRTNSAIIDLIKLPDPLKTKNTALFLRQYIYQHEGQKVKNSLKEGLIEFARTAYGKTLTKNQARNLIVESEIDTSLLDRIPRDSNVYKQIGIKLNITI